MDLPPPIGVTAPQLIGTLFNWALYGVLTMQTYVYYLNFSDDGTWTKILVYGTYVFETIQTAMTAVSIYIWFASGFGNLDMLVHVNISPIHTPIQCGLMAAVVQCFFAYRIFVLRKSYLWICVLIVLTAMVQTVGAIGGAIRSFKLQEYPLFHENLFFPQAVDLWLVGDTVCDTLISGTMLLLFFQARKEGTNHSSKILGKLVRLIVETNALTAGMALASLISFVAIPNSNVFVATTLVMGKLYSNTLLATFNNRIHLRNMNRGTLYSSGRSDRLPMNRPQNNASNPYHSDNNLGGLSLTTGSYEIEISKDHKLRELTSVVSVSAVHV